MNTVHASIRPRLWGVIAAALVSVAACSTMGYGDRGALTLSGDHEVPAVMTPATGSGTITVAADHSVSGSVTTAGMAGTMAHIHMGAAGKNGPVIIPLMKSGDSTWSVPEGAKLSDAQYEAYKAGDLYVNVHSAAHKGGEIRAQLMP